MGKSVNSQVGGVIMFLENVHLFMSYTDEHLAEYYARLSVNASSVDALCELMALRYVIIQRFIDSVIYFPADRKGGGKDGNSDND